MSRCPYPPVPNNTLNQIATGFAASITYADDQLALWNASSFEAAAAEFDASVNITAADLQGVNSFTIADTIIGGAPYPSCMHSTHQDCAALGC